MFKLKMATSLPSLPKPNCYVRIGPLFLVLVSSRFNRKDARQKERNNTYLTNISIVVLYAVIISIIDGRHFTHSRNGLSRGHWHMVVLHSAYV